MIIIKLNVQMNNAKNNVISRCLSTNTIYTRRKYSSIILNSTSCFSVRGKFISYER